MILSCGSEYFDKLFNSQFNESRAGIVEVPNTDPDAFEAILRYLTLDDTSFEDTLLPSVQQLAQKFGVTSLVRVCKERTSNDPALLMQRIAGDVAAFRKRIANFQVEALVFAHLSSILLAFLEENNKGRSKYLVHRIAISSLPDLFTGVSSEMWAAYEKELRARLEELGFSITDWQLRIPSRPSAIHWNQ